MYERPFDFDPLTGIRTTFVQEHVGDDEFKLVRTQDIEGTLQNNLDQRNHRASGWKGDLHHVGRLPNLVIEEHKRLGIDLINDQEALKIWINDPDNSQHRTRRGKV